MNRQKATITKSKTSDLDQCSACLFCTGAQLICSKRIWNEVYICMIMYVIKCTLRCKDATYTIC